MDETLTSQSTGPRTDWFHAPTPSAEELPSNFRLLVASPCEPDWIALTLQLDAVGCHDGRLRWSSSANETLSILRNETFDCLMVLCDRALSGEHWDGLALVRAIRTSGCDDPLIVLSSKADDQITLEACAHHCDVLITPGLLNSRTLIPFIQRCLRHVETARENHQHNLANHRRLVRERDEADHLLRQQRDIIQELEALTQGFPIENSPLETEESAFGIRPAASRRTIDVPPEIAGYYQELLRTYVIMGSGSLGAEITQLASILAQLGLSPGDALSLHLERVEELVKGLGNRSTRHVMARADLLALEIVIRLGECYQKASQENSVRE